MTDATTVLPALIDAQRKTTEQFGKLCEEGLRFAALRTEENTRVLRDFAASRDLPGRVSVWNDYIARATQQYTEEFKLLSAICAEPAKALVGEEPAVLADLPIAPAPDVTDAVLSEETADEAVAAGEAAAEEALAEVGIATPEAPTESPRQD